MDFIFSDDDEQLRAAVQRWVSRSYSFERRREIVRAGGFSRTAWDELAGLGVCGLYLPTHLGGLGLGAVEAMVVMEELGRGMVLEPFAQTLIAGVLLARHGDATLQSVWCERVASGAAIVVLAHQERESRYRLTPCRTLAVQEGTVWTLTGHKSIVPAGDHASAFIVPALTQGRLALFVVERAAAGLATRAYVTQDGSRAAELSLAHAPAALLCLDDGAALDLAIDIGIAATCAEAVGVMENTLALTLDYLKTRRQFGVEIASFQALRHRVADMKMQLELARSMSYYASLKLDAPAPERQAAASRAKYQLGTSMRFIGQQAIQLHGGIGLTDEYIVSHYFKKLTQLEMSFGDTLHHLGQVSAHMQDGAGVLA